jgi:hypothetical protein
MAVSEAPYDEAYQCSFLGKSVRVDGLLETYSGPGGLTLVRQMSGCTGSRLCKKFPMPSAFNSKASFGCPYHDSLHRD